jgi:hypothetical protein
MLPAVSAVRMSRISLLIIFPFVTSHRLAWEGRHGPDEYRVVPVNGFLQPRQTVKKPARVPQMRGFLRRIGALLNGSLTLVSEYDS